jgi:hypothetical protein
LGGIFTSAAMIRLACASGSGDFAMTTKPWDDPPRPEHGDKKANTTYEAVGRALSQWEHVECKCAELFAILVETHWDALTLERPIHPAIQAYGSVLGSAARTIMIEYASRAYFRWYPNENLQKRLSHLITTEVSKLAKKRDYIAHGIVDLRFSFRENKKAKLGYWLVPSYYASKTNPIEGPNAYAYTADSINYFTKQFDRLWIELDKLQQDILAAQTSQ